MNTVYRLYTERKPNLAELAARYFQGFTLLDAQGYYDGIPEPAAIVEVIGDDSDASRVFLLASHIREANTQTSVLVTRAPVMATFVTADNAVEVA